MTATSSRPFARRSLPATIAGLLLAAALAPAATSAATIPTFVPIGAGYEGRHA